MIIWITLSASAMHSFVSVCIGELIPSYIIIVLLDIFCAYFVHCIQSLFNHIYCNCIPRTKYVRGILWFSRRYAAASASAASAASASAFHRLRDNLKKPYRIASIFYM